MDNLLEPFKKMKLESGVKIGDLLASFERMKLEESEEFRMKMHDLPILAFEKILGYLSLADRIRSRAVSRGWRDCIDSLKVKSLFCSDRPKTRLVGKVRLVSGAFAQNAISSAKFKFKFNLDTFDQSIFSSLKRLRLCGLDINEENGSAFASTLSSFRQLEELGLFSFNLANGSKVRKEVIKVKFGQPRFNLDLELKLPMLNNIQLENVFVIEKLTLDTPRLRKIKLGCCYTLRVDLVHGESVEKLIVDNLDSIKVKKLKNLKYLYVDHFHFLYPEIDSTLLSSLEQLTEVYLVDMDSFSMLFEQKQRYNRLDLKIYLCGLLLDNLDDSAINMVSSCLDNEYLLCLAENPSRLADEIPFSELFHYQTIELVLELVTPALAIDLVSRFSDLKELIVSEPVQNTQRFLDFLEIFDKISTLRFYCDRPQELFDRLPDHGAVQVLTIEYPPSDFGFLTRLKSLIDLTIRSSIDVELIRRVLEELELLSVFQFNYLSRLVTVEIDHRKDGKQFELSGNGKRTKVADLSAAIQFIESLPENAEEQPVLHCLCSTEHAVF